MTFNAIRPVFVESDDEITIQFGVQQGLAGPGAFDLVPGDGIIIDGVPGTGVDPFSTLLVAGDGIDATYNPTTRQWTISLLVSAFIFSKVFNSQYIGLLN